MFHFQIPIRFKIANVNILIWDLITDRADEAKRMTLHGLIEFTECLVDSINLDTFVKPSAGHFS